MKYTIVTLLIMALTATTVAVAQDGSAQGPPKLPIIVMPRPIPVPTTASPTGPARKFFQLQAELASMAK